MQSWIVWGLLFVTFLVAGQSKDVAVVVSTKSYHLEIVALMAYHLRRMDLDVHVFLEKPVIRKNVAGALELVGNYSSSIHELPENAAAAVRFEWPKAHVGVVINSDEKNDLISLCERGIYNSFYRSNDRMIMVVHNGDFGHLVPKICAMPYCTMLVLGSHVYDTVSAKLSMHRVVNATVRWVSASILLPSSYLLPSTTRSAISHSRPTSNTSHVIVQGTVRKQRRKYKELFQCLDELSQNGHQLTVSLLGKSHTDEIAIPSSVAHMVHRVHNLPYLQFFHLLATADYIATFANTEAFGYARSRATSSIPTALSVEVPIIVPGKLLRLYPCLRSQRTYTAIGQTDDCASLRAALTLNPEDRTRLRTETRLCRQTLVDEAAATLRSIVYGQTSAGRHHSQPRSRVDQCLLLPLRRL